jgi:hypothetical protein
MIGTFQSFQVAHGPFGHQYTTIDGRVYVTRFDLQDPNLKGLEPGCRVVFHTRPAPTVLCRSPWVQDGLPSATLLRVVARGIR